MWKRSLHFSLKSIILWMPCVFFSICSCKWFTLVTISVILSSTEKTVLELFTIYVVAKLFVTLRRYLYDVMHSPTFITIPFKSSNFWELIEDSCVISFTKCSSLTTRFVRSPTNENRDTFENNTFWLKWYILIIFLFGLANTKCLKGQNTVFIEVLGNRFPYPYLVES